MSLALSLESLTSGVGRILPEMIVSFERTAIRSIQHQGEFPISLSLLENVRATLSAGTYTVQNLADMISADPVLVIRILNLANQGVHSRGKSVHSLSGAISVLGALKLPELISQYAEAKNFQAMYLGRAVSATVMQQTIVAGILAQKLVTPLAPKQQLEEMSQNIAILMSLPGLLLAYFKPNVYSACFFDSLDGENTFERNFRRSVQKSVSKFSQRIAETLPLPKEYEQIAGLFDIPPWKRRSWAVDNAKDATAIVTAVYVALRLAQEICSFRGHESLITAIKEMSVNSYIEKAVIFNAIANLPERYLQHSRSIGLKAFRLPDYLGRLVEPNITPPKWPGLSERINPFLYELKACFKTRPSKEEFHRVPQAVLCTLEAFIKGLNFDRAVLLAVNERNQTLEPSVMVGAEAKDYLSLRHKTWDSEHADLPSVQAFLNRQPVFFGEPIFGDDWPVAAFPVISGGKLLGVFYADKAARADAVSLETQEQVAVIALAEEWHDVPLEFY
jgi:hypothetical protein